VLHPERLDRRCDLRDLGHDLGEGWAQVVTRLSSASLSTTPSSVFPRVSCAVVSVNREMSCA
jgi:hypothetical protein